MAVKSLAEWDGWVLWATKARILYERPADAAEIVREAFYRAPSYPLGLPALEATTMRAAGTFDPVLVDLQILVLMAAALVGIWALLSAVAHPLLIGVALLAPAASTTLTYQLTTNYADVPLAFLVALGVVAGAVWLAAGDEREPWQLVCVAISIAFAAWTKNEGLIFGSRPWRGSSSPRCSSGVDDLPSSPRVGVRRPRRAVATLRQRATIWLALSSGGLVVTYWVSSHRLDDDLDNSSYRTVVTLLVGGLCMSPALLQVALQPEADGRWRPARMVGCHAALPPRQPRDTASWLDAAGPVRLLLPRVVPLEVPRTDVGMPVEKRVELTIREA
jgi:hypothetical protein